MENMECLKFLDLKYLLGISGKISKVPGVPGINFVDLDYLLGIPGNPK